MEDEIRWLEASDLKRVLELEAENAKLKRMYAELALENTAMKNLLQKTLGPDGKRASARYLVQAHRLPVTRACRCVGLHRSAWYFEPEHWAVRDAEVIAALVEGRPSRGFWKCRKLLSRQGRPWNHKRIYRVYKLMRLHLRRPARR